MSNPSLSGNVRVVNGNWIARFRLPSGLDTRRKLGPAWTKRGEQPPSGYFTERTARMALDKILSQYEGWTPGSDPQFRFAADEFLAWCRRDRQLRESTCHEYERIISKRLVPALGRKTLSNITEQDINLLRADLAGMSGSSINQTKIVLAGIVKCAQKKRGYRGDDPSRFFDRAPQSTKTHIDVYTPAEIELLARSTREGRHHKSETRITRSERGNYVQRPMTPWELAERRRVDDQDAVIFKTCAYAGLRLSEIRALRWRDVDFAGAKLTVRSGYTNHGKDGPTKSGRIRTIPMTSRLAAELDSLSRRSFAIGAEDRVFCDDLGNVLSGSGIYHRFVRSCEAAGLRRLKLHSLRHTAGTMWVQKFDITRIQEWLGHADIKTTLIYLHYKPRHEDAADMDALLDANLGPQDTEHSEAERRQDERTF